MSDDRELLEKAAKAAGYEYEWDQPRGAARPVWIRIKQHDRMIAWRPLTDDGDALRLAVKLGLAIVPYPIYAKPKHSVIAKQYDHARYLRGEGSDVLVEEIEVYGDDPAAATRRCIVRAAASIGPTP